MSDALASECLRALLAHDAAETRVRWLMLEGSEVVEFAEAVANERACFEAYEVAARAWQSRAVDAPRVLPPGRRFACADDCARPCCR